MSSIKASDRCTTFLLWIPVRRFLEDPVTCYQLKRQTAARLFYYGYRSDAFRRSGCMSSTKASDRLHDIVLLWIRVRRFLDDPVRCYQLKRQTAARYFFIMDTGQTLFRRSVYMLSIKA